jgi:hypothetical protein
LTEAAAHLTWERPLVCAGVVPHRKLLGRCITYSNCHADRFARPVQVQKVARPYREVASLALPAHIDPDSEHPIELVEVADLSFQLFGGEREGGVLDAVSYDLDLVCGGLEHLVGVGNHPADCPVRVRDVVPELDIVLHDRLESLSNRPIGVVQVADLTAYGEERGTNRVGSHLGKQCLQQWIGRAELHVRGREEEVYSMTHHGHNLGEGRDVVPDR